MYNVKYIMGKTWYEWFMPADLNAQDGNGFVWRKHHLELPELDQVQPAMVETPFIQTDSDIVLRAKQMIQTTEL